MSDILREGLSELGFAQTAIPLFAQKLGAYIEELQLFNSAYNLVNTSDFEELAVRHVFDSLSAHDIINSLAADMQSESVIRIGDIGSGGGNCAAVLGLENVIVQKSEAEKIPEESFDIAVFRALKPLDERFAKTLLSLIKKGGCLAAYKAKKSNIEKEMHALKAVIAEYTAFEVRVPFMENAERHIVVVKKLGVLPAR